MSLSRPAIPTAFGRSPKHHGATWTSRDYDLSIIPCCVTVCPANKAQFCTMASLIDISADGQCKTGARFITTPPKVVLSTLQRPHDGD